MHHQPVNGVEIPCKKFKSVTLKLTLLFVFGDGNEVNAIDTQFNP